MMTLMLFLLACGPTSNEDCVVYYDKCNAGCEPQCGSQRDANAVERAGICDLGCMDSGSTDECVLRDGECTWLVDLSK